MRLGGCPTPTTRQAPGGGPPLSTSTEIETSSYQGLARDFPDQVSAPPPKPPKDATDVQRTEYGIARKAQSSQRICVEHAIAEPKQWRPLQRYIGRREHFEDTMLAVAGLVSDRCAER